MDIELQERMIEWFSHPIVPDLTRRVHVALRQRIIEVYPHALGSLPDAMMRPSGYEGVGKSSGNQWEITLDAQGRHVPDARMEEGPLDVTGCRLWEIAASGRAPILCAVERKGVEPRGWSDVIHPVGADLQRWAQSLCSEFGLEYVDGAELWAWKVPESLLTPDILFRLDYTEDPCAFQLLFHE